MARDVNYNINIDAGNGPQTLGDLEGLAAKLNEEIREVDRSSEEFQTMSRRIQEVNIQLEMANSEIEGFTERRRIMAMQGAIDVFAGGIEAASGLAVQLGLSNDQFEEVVQNLLAVQSTANGIRTVTQGVADLREATRGLTLAQLRFNAAALANPYVIAAAVIVTAIASVVTQFDRFREAVGDVGISLPDFSRTWEAVGDVVRSVAAGIATQLGVVTRGFIQLFNGDFSGAFDSFRDALTFDSARTAAIEEFNAEPEEVDTETLTENAKEAGRATADGALCGVEEATQERPEAVSVLVGTGLAPAGLMDVPGAEIQTTGGDEVAELAGVTARMNAAEALDAFQEDIAERRIGREERLTTALRTAFADNVEISKAIAIAEGALAAGRSVRDTIDSVGTIRSNLAKIPQVLPPGVPNPAYPLAAATAGVNTGLEIALGAADLAAIVSNTQQTVSALEGGGTFNPTPGGVSQPGFAGPTVATPDLTATAGLPQDTAQALATMMEEMVPQAVIAEGDITNSQERAARSRMKRRLNRRSNG